MDLITNNVVLLLTNLFEIYIMYRFMSIFFDACRVNFKIAVSIYIIRFVIGSIIMIAGTYPVINLIFSIIGLFFITLCYEATFSKRVLITFIIYMCMFLTEAVVSLIMENSNFHTFRKIEHIDAMISIIIEVGLWSLTLLLGKFRNIRKNFPVPMTFVIAIIIVFLISFYMEILIFRQKNVNDLIATMSMVCVLLLNFVMIYLYDSLAGIFEERTKAQLIQREKAYYHTQSELLQKNYDELKQFRHDMKNRMLAIKEMLDSNETEKIYNYISRITEKIEHTEIFSQTGNIAIDSIINYKLTKAYNRGIQVKADIAVPADIKIDDDDMVIILGNLIDNAIEAAEMLEKNKYININFEYEKDCIFINIRNSYDNIVKVLNGRIVTRKGDHIMHGIGLRSVQAAIEKYDGLLDLDYRNKEFIASVILYI